MKQEFINELTPVFENTLSELMPIIRELIPLCQKNGFYHEWGHKDILKTSKEGKVLDKNKFFENVFHYSKAFHISLQEEVSQICKKYFPSLNSDDGINYSLDTCWYYDSYNRILLYFIKEKITALIKKDSENWESKIPQEINEWIGNIYDFFEKKEVTIITKWYLTNVRIDKNIFMTHQWISITIGAVQKPEFSETINEIWEELGRIGRGNMYPDCSIAIQESLDVHFPPMSSESSVIIKHKEILENVLYALHVYKWSWTNIIHYSQQYVWGIWHQPEREYMPYPEVYKDDHWWLWIQEEDADKFSDFYEKFKKSYQFLHIPIKRLTDAKRRLHDEDAIIDAMIWLEWLFLDANQTHKTQTIKKRFMKWAITYYWLDKNHEWIWWDFIMQHMYTVRWEIVHCNWAYLKREKDDIRRVREQSQEFLQAVVKYIIENNLAEKLMKDKTEWWNL